jgi:hypothetical protein
VADINDADGQFARDGLTSACTANSAFRQSALTARAQFSEPRLELHVPAKTIRADELIFPSEKAVLRDVDGRLVIDKGGILFDPVRLRLNGGTAVVVTGSLKDFSAPQVNLDIEAERADIDEVIALWNRGAEATSQQQRAGQRESHRADRRGSRKGSGAAEFPECRGKISFMDGTVTIFPLRVDAGAGRCTGQVEVARQPDGSSLLKMSGHLENFDAAAVQHEILKMRGLITGTLKGDFYLEGEPGSNFLPSSLGGFSLQIKDGVLRKFPFLSKVFSCSTFQILTFNLSTWLRGCPSNG